MYVRDQLVRELHGAMGQVAPRGRWVEVYVNGVYWGLYNLTERIDERFLATHFDHDFWDLVAADTEGDSDEYVAWNAFVDWITSADLSAAAQYEQAVRQLDIENFTSFIILHLWAGNIDWGDNNWNAVRMRDGPDGRWRLFVWDAELTFGLAQGSDSIEDIAFSHVVINAGARGPLASILASLLASPQYQAYFSSQVEQHLAGALATESVRQRLAAMTVELRPATAAEASRWLPEQEPAVMAAQWETAMQRISDSLESHAQRLRQLSDIGTLWQLLPHFPVSDNLTPLPSGTRIALLVHNPVELALGDVAVAAHLAARGGKVTVLGTDESSQHDPAQVAASHDLLLVSSSIQSLDPAVRYTQTATPLIFWAPLLLEATPLVRRGGTRPDQNDIRIVNAEHPITAGLPADRMLLVVRRPDTFSVAWPTNGPEVRVLAMHRFGGDYALLAAEAGAELANGQTAKARTVFIFWHHDTFHWITDSAARLFDRSVDWALGLPSGSGPG